MRRPIQVLVPAASYQRDLDEARQQEASAVERDDRRAAAGWARQVVRLTAAVEAAKRYG